MRVARLRRACRALREGAWCTGHSYIRTPSGTLTPTYDGHSPPAAHLYHSQPHLHKPTCRNHLFCRTVLAPPLPLAPCVPLGAILGLGIPASTGPGALVAPSIRHGSWCAPHPPAVPNRRRALKRLQWFAPTPIPAATPGAVTGLKCTAFSLVPTLPVPPSTSCPHHPASDGGRGDMACCLPLGVCHRVARLPGPSYLPWGCWHRMCCRRSEVWCEPATSICMLLVGEGEDCIGGGSGEGPLRSSPLPLVGFRPF